MATGILQYNIQRNWAVTNVNAVGATIDTVARPNSSLEWPASRSDGTPDLDTINVTNDANTIYLDPASGNDANTGTDLLSDAILTISRANALLDLTRHTLHVERTDSLTTSTITFDTYPGEGLTLQEIMHFQVASGQTASINPDVSVEWLAAAEAFVSGAASINGFIVTKPTGTSFTMPEGDASSTVRNCTFFLNEVQSVVATRSLQFYNNLVVIQDPTIEQIIVDVNDVITSQSSNIHNNIFAATGASVSLVSAIAARVGRPGISTVSASIAMSNNTFHNIGNAVVFIAPFSAEETDAVLVTVNKNNIINNVGKVLDSRLTVVATASVGSHDIDWSLINNTGTGDAVIGANSLLDVNPLLINVSQNDFRPAHVSDDFNGIFFPITSPAIDADDVAGDMGAIQRTFVDNGEISDNHTLFDCGYSIIMSPSRINYQEFSDIQGNQHNIWDEVKNEVVLTLPKDYYVAHEQSAGLDTVIRFLGSKRFYPNGAAGMFDADLTISGTNNITTNEIVATIPQASLPGGTLLPRWFTGWVLHLIDGGNTGFWQITDISTSGTDEIVTAEFLRGDAVSGPTFTNFDINVLYMPMIIAMKKIDFDSDYYNTDIKTWLKDSTTDTTGEFHTRKLIFSQTREYLHV